MKEIKSNRIFIILLGIIVLAGISAISYAQVPRTISYQGYLTDTGTFGPITDPALPVRFSLHDALTGGSELWFETQDVNVNQGVYSVELGSSTPIPASLDFNSQYYLEVAIDEDASTTFDSGEELTPRQALASVPYALSAETVAIPLTISGSRNNGGLITVTNYDTSGIGVFGQATGVSGKGLYGTASNTAGIGVYGRVDSGYGVYGTSYGSGTAGYFTSNTGAAGYFRSTSGYGLIVESGNVGIGIGTPAYSLDVAGTINASTAIKVNGIDVLTSYTETDPVFSVWDRSTGISITESQISNLSHFTTANETDPTVNSLGKATLSCSNNQVAKLIGSVWVCSAAVQAPLFLSDFAPFGSTIAGINLDNNGDAGVYGSYAGSGTGSGVKGISTGGEGVRGESNSGAGGYFTSTSGYGLIVDNGNVGIGTTVPLYKLDIGSIADPWNYIRVGSSNFGGVLFYDGQDTNSGSIVYRHSDDSMRFTVRNGISSIESMSLLSSGNVGIGTTTPTEKLTVAGTIESTTGGIRFPDGTTQTTADFHSLDAADGDPVDAIYVNNFGNVGIGTTFPADNLDIVGTMTQKSGDYYYEYAGNFAVTGHLAPRCSCDSSTIRTISAPSPKGCYSKTDDGLTCYDWYTSDYSYGGPPRSIEYARVLNTPDLISADKYGKVKIGWGISTSSRLTVFGSVYVDGSIYATGAITPGSSRELKEDIRELSADEAIKTLSNLTPQKFYYKADREDEHVGFIAEDVPNLVATKDRKGVDPMDVVAVLTKVVQEQQRTIEAMNKKLTELKKAMVMRDNLAAVDTNY